MISLNVLSTLPIVTHPRVPTARNLPISPRSLLDIVRPKLSEVLLVLA